MSNVLRIALVDPNDGTRESLKAMLLGMDTVWLEADCSRYEFFPDVIEQTGPDVGVISLDNNPDKAIDLIQRLGRDAPETAILAASEDTDGHLILRTIRAGAREFLTLPVSDEDLSSALQRVSQLFFLELHLAHIGFRLPALLRLAVLSPDSTLQETAGRAVLST